MTEMTSGVIATGLGFILLVTLISWGLAHIAKRLPDSIPRIAKIVVCGTLVQTTFLVSSHMAFAEESFVDWLLNRPTRYYFLVPGMLFLGCLASWSVLRNRGQKLDVGVFE